MYSISLFHGEKITDMNGLVSDCSKSSAFAMELLAVIN